MKLDFKGMNVTVIRSSRRTISIQLKPSEIIMRVPNYLPQREVKAFLLEKSAWIEKHQRRMKEQAAKLDEMPKLTMKEIQDLADKAVRVIPKKVKYYAPKIGVDYGKITIRNQKTRWGSCSSKGNLNFNCLLMLTPNKVIDSVVVHELCHRKHMNHSKAFYDEVEKAFPEYKLCHKWLKENGGLILKRLP